MTRNFIAALIAVALMLPAPAAAHPSTPARRALSAVEGQATGDIWRTFAQKLDAGSDVRVRLQNGQRFRATLIEARSDALVLQPRTRRPVPVQSVAYDAITSLERHDNRGSNVGKAIGIGAAVGAGTFLAILAILFATVD
jgi:hypothetical protein